MPREGNVHTLENKVSWEPHGRIAQCPVTRKKKASEKGACSCREGNVRPVLEKKTQRRSVASESIDSYRDLDVQNKTVLGENPGGAGAWGLVGLR